MIKTKTDGQSEANTPLTHILSIYLFDSVVFLPPSVIIWKRSWWPLLLITFWHLGATVVLSTAAAEAPPTVRGFDVRAARPLPPRCRLKFLRDRFLRSARGSSASASATRRPLLVCFQSLDDTKHTDMSWMTSRRSLHRRRPLARKNLLPTSCCGSDMGCCIMSCVSFHPAVAPCRRTRVATPQRQARNPKATSLLPNAPTIRWFYCRTLICTIFSTAGSSQLTYTHIHLRARTHLLVPCQLQTWEIENKSWARNCFKESGRVRKRARERERKQAIHYFFCPRSILDHCIDTHSVSFWHHSSSAGTLSAKIKARDLYLFVSGIPIHRSHFSQPLCK